MPADRQYIFDACAVVYGPRVVLRGKENVLAIGTPSALVYSRKPRLVTGPSEARSTFRGSNCASHRLLRDEEIEMSSGDPLTTASTGKKS